MKKISTIMAIILLSGTLHAKEISLSQKEIDTWQIHTQKPQTTKMVPLGSFLVKVTTPPTMMQTISLPFKAQVTSLNVALYQKVKKGELLATVTGTEWIEAQQKAIEDAIELTHHTHTYERKRKLCKEQIIPQKECIAALAELKTDKIKVAASKALLRSYGASAKIIKDLFEKFTIHRTIPITAPTDGTITQMHASLGESTDPSSALFVIQKEGDLWLESDLPNVKSKLLKENQEVLLKIEQKQYRSKVLQIAPILNSQNQTRSVRLLLKKGSDLLPGMRSEAAFILPLEALKVPKKAVIKLNGRHVVFVKKDSGFEDIAVDILGEDQKYYYVQKLSKLSMPIVVSGVAILKNMAGEGDE